MSEDKKRKFDELGEKLCNAILSLEFNNSPIIKQEVIEIDDNDNSTESESYLENEEEFDDDETVSENESYIPTEDIFTFQNFYICLKKISSFFYIYFI